MGPVRAADAVPFLPEALPVLDAVSAARRQRSGVDGRASGGDWSDVIRLSGGRAALVVGDVVGRGAAAAVAREQLRTAVLTLAVLDPPADEMLTHLDELAREHGQAQLATCLYAVYDPVRRRLRYASAGHLPPVLVPAGDTPRLLPTPVGAPLGVWGIGFEVQEVAITDGAVLVLYTDGLVEARGRDIHAGLADLLDAVRAATGPGGVPDPAVIGDTILDNVRGSQDPDGRGAAPDDGQDVDGQDVDGQDVDGRDDDVALLVALLGGIGTQWQATWAVPGDVAAVRQAREHVTRQLELWGLRVLTDTAALLVSEVVTNAIRYARDPITLSMLALRDRVEVAVVDSDSRLPRLRRAGEQDEGGRGLRLVEELSTRWGAHPSGGGKVVWFALGRPGT